MHNEGMFEYNKIPTVTISSYRSDPSTGCIKSCWSNALHGSRAFVSYQFKNHALTGFGSIIHRALFVAALQDETVWLRECVGALKVLTRRAEVEATGEFASCRAFCRRTAEAVEVQGLNQLSWNSVWSIEEGSYESVTGSAAVIFVNYLVKEIDGLEWPCRDDPLCGEFNHLHRPLREKVP